MSDITSIAFLASVANYFKVGTKIKQSSIFPRNLTFAY